MKVTRLTKKLLKRRRANKHLELRAKLNKLKWKYNAACGSEKRLNRELLEAIDQNNAQRREFDFKMRQLMEGIQDHWMLVIEDDTMKQVYHFEGQDAKRLAKMAFNDNVQPKKAVIIAKVFEWSGSYSGMHVRGGLVRRKEYPEIGQTNPKLIEITNG